ncbi:MAG: translation elongation factor 4 [Candidatus Cloacimonetes bacterium]|nr:translation elongation factor 4 [Candidatus Cloacimonadota bacterium]
MKQENIRIFSIIAHIDHGKSTLADRIMNSTGTVADRLMKEQLLDSMDIERERGITIKSQAVECLYKAKNGETYYYYLIDTPGHVDFTYEVSRALAACDGAILVVDAAQGLESQTMANMYLALDNDLDILPVVNKIDLPAARPDEVAEEIEEVLGIDAADVVPISAKNGIGIDDLLEKIHEAFPPPEVVEDAPLKALVFDAKFESYRGVIIYIRVFDGEIKKGSKIKMMATGNTFDVAELGVFTPAESKVDSLMGGQVGYFTASIKSLGEVSIGDTVTSAESPCIEPLKGFKPVKQMVYCGLYPVSSDDYEDLKAALEKMQLNDSSISYEPDTSVALGFGFRCGFLGLLHSDVIQDRLEREFDLDLVATAPSVVYRVHMVSGDVIDIDNPSKLPEPNLFEYIEEPYIDMSIYMPKEYTGSVMSLCEEKRATYSDMEYLDKTRVILKYSMPLSEMIVDFYDRLKSCTQGYASVEYDFSEYKRGQLVKMEIAIGGDAVDAFTMIVPKDKAFYRGRELTVRLKDLIPRHQFEVAIQAMIGSRVISRTSVKALRKNVLAKCYGGDISRKKKLLQKQKKGKKRMKMIGSVEVPQEAFMAVLDISEK